MSNEDHRELNNLKYYLYGKIGNIPISTDKTILNSLIEAKLDPPYSCKIGACSACMAKLISGEVTIVDNGYLSEDQIAQNYFLSCQAFPLSENCEIDFE